MNSERAAAKSPEQQQWQFFSRQTNKTKQKTETNLRCGNQQRLTDILFRELKQQQQKKTHRNKAFFNCSNNNNKKNPGDSRKHLSKTCQKKRTLETRR